MNSSSLLTNYHARAYVQYASAIPEISRGLSVLGGVQGGSAHFDPASPKYLVTIVSLPAALFALGVLSMLAVLASLASRFLFRFMDCYPTRASPEDKAKRRTCWREEAHDRSLTRRAPSQRQMRVRRARDNSHLN